MITKVTEIYFVLYLRIIWDSSSLITITEWLHYQWSHKDASVGLEIKVKKLGFLTKMFRR